MFKRPLLFLSALFIVSHIFHLALLPIFMDETNYLDWGWREVHEGIPYHSLYDGKQPLLMWIYGVLQTLPVDPLWICRFFSVITGLTAMIGIYLIALRLFNRKIALLSALLYTFTPLFFFYNRQALMESPLSAVSVWSFYFLLEIFHRPRFSPAAASGLILGVGYFIKSTALVFLAQFIFLYFLFLLVRRREIIRHINLFLVFISAFLLVNIPLFLQSSFWSSLPASVRYSLSLSELTRLPLSLWLHNLIAVLEISFFHLTPLLFLTVLIGAILLLRQKKFIFLSLLLWIILSFAHTVIFARSVNFRYLEPYLPLAVIPAAFFLVSLRRLLCAVTFAIPTTICLLQVISPLEYFRLMARFTRYSYIEGYVTGDSTGYQALNSVRYFQQLAEKESFIIGIPLNVGNPESTLLVYLRRYPGITITYMDSRLFGSSLTNIDCLTAGKPLYFLARQEQQAGLDKYFIPVTKITNIYNSDYHTVYALNPVCTGNTLPLNLVKR